MNKSLALMACLLLVSFTSASFLYTPAQIIKQAPLMYYLNGESFNFTPDDVGNQTAWAIKTDEGFKWSLNFTLPSNNYKLKFSVDGRAIKEVIKDKRFRLGNKIEIDFSDAIASGLTVKLNANKLEVSGWSNAFVGSIVSLDPLVTQSSTTDALKWGNQRKYLVNNIDGSLWASFVGNGSCYTGWSNNSGVTWNLTNVSRGTGADQYCSIDVDDYGNVWSYWFDGTVSSIYGRLFGWNSTGWDLSASWNLTHAAVAYASDFALKTCNKTVGLVYAGDGYGAEACFKRCLNIQNGGCNSTSTSWNSTNNTLNSFCSFKDVSTISSPALDCASGHFVLVTAQDAGSAQTKLTYGKNLLNGDYLWNTGAFTFTYGATDLNEKPSLAHNGSTLFLTGKTTYLGSTRVYFKECGQGTGCNVTGNWTADILLSGNGGGDDGLQVGVFNNSPIAAWVESFSGSNAVLGKFYNQSNGAWTGTQIFASAAGKDLRYPFIPSNSSNTTNYTIMFYNLTNNEVWTNQFDLTFSGILGMTAFDEQTNAQIMFSALFYNTSGTSKTYTNVTSISAAASSFPQGANTIYVTNESNYYPRYYFTTISGGSSQSIVAYLLPNTATALAVRFHIRTGIGSTIPVTGANVKVQRNIGGNIVTVNEMLSDFNGDALVYMEAGVPYYLTVTASGYGTFFGTINPSTTDYTITLYAGGSTGGSNSTMNATPFLPTILDDVYFWVSPFEHILWYNSSNITFFINSTNNNLTSFGMNITNDTNDNLYFANITTSPSGGLLYYYYNVSTCNCVEGSNLTVHIWFTRNPAYDNRLFYWINPVNSTSIIGTLVGFRENLKEGGYSQLGQILIVLFITALISAFVCRMNLVAGLFVAMILLGFFAMSGMFTIQLGSLPALHGAAYIIIAFATAISLLYLQGRGA